MYVGHLSKVLVKNWHTIDGLGYLLDINCRAPLHEECPKYHGHKGDPSVTPEICGAVGERA